MKIYMKYAAPALNTPEFSRVFNPNGFERDAKGHIRALELIALPGMSGDVMEKIGGICKVSLSDYPSPVFIDSRFTDTSFQDPEATIKLTSETILEKLAACAGYIYGWGCNWSAGIPQMLDFYPPNKSLSEEEKNHRQFKGMADCSGLLFEATHGYTPRNTSDLLRFGQEVQKDDLRPLDLLVKRGHVIIVLNSGETIESGEIHGVIKKPLAERLDEIADEPYICRRWIEQDETIIRNLTA